jgi:hypothetical protein
VKAGTLLLPGHRALAIARDGALMFRGCRSAVIVETPVCETSPCQIFEQHDTLFRIPAVFRISKLAVSCVEKSVYCDVSLYSKSIFRVLNFVDATLLFAVRFTSIMFLTNWTKMGFRPLGHQAGREILNAGGFRRAQ